jgi:hypothetical protein
MKFLSSVVPEILGEFREKKPASEDGLKLREIRIK